MMDYKLPDEDLQLIHSARCRLDSAWRVIAKRVLQRMGESRDIPKMILYQAFGYACGKKSVTIRQWSRLECRFGDALDELPEGYSIGVDQLRLVEMEARQTKAAPVEVLLRRINESDGYGSQFIPPDVYRLQLAAPKPHEERPDLAALEWAERCLMKFCKQNSSFRKRGEMVLDEIGKLKKMAGKV